MATILRRSGLPPINTTTSMGRLTLNVLLSFAQYERECIRDKIAGSRCAASAEITPCVYDERPRLPVGLAVGAADQAPRACDSARSLTGKERAISRFGLRDRASRHSIG